MNLITTNSVRYIFISKAWIFGGHESKNDEYMFQIEFVEP